MQEFSISDSISSNRTKPQPAASHDPFSQPAAPERNAEDPLAMFNDSDPRSSVRMSIRTRCSATKRCSKREHF
jgi:hypothetical protein